jgi:hypothetical protein
MKRARLVVWFLGLFGLAALLAWLISGYVRQNLILPSLEFAWLAQNYFAMIPQTWLWNLALALVFATALFSLAAKRIDGLSGWARHQPTRSRGRELAFWLKRVNDGAYQRWYVAHHLAHLAIDILRARGAQIERGDPLTGPGWDPPGQIQKYLQAAMYSSPATFGPAARAAGIETDPPLESVVAYFETYMETSDEY